MMTIHEWLRITDSHYKLLLLCQNCGHPWARYHVEPDDKCVLGPGHYKINFINHRLDPEDIQRATHHHANEDADIMEMGRLNDQCDHRTPDKKLNLTDGDICGYCGRWARYGER